MKFCGGPVDSTIAISKFKQALKRNMQQAFNFKTWAVLSKRNNQLIGILTLFRTDNTKQAASLEIGIMLAKHGQGKLIPEEAMGALMEWAFHRLPLQNIVAKFDIKNVATKRFVKKLGFTFITKQHETETQYIEFKKEDWIDNLIISS